MKKATEKNIRSIKRGQKTGYKGQKGWIFAVFLSPKGCFLRKNSFFAKVGTGCFSTHKNTRKWRNHGQNEHIWMCFTVSLLSPTGANRGQNEIGIFRILTPRKAAK